MNFSQSSGSFDFSSYDHIERLLLSKADLSQSLIWLLKDALRESGTELDDLRDSHLLFRFDEVDHLLHSGVRAVEAPHQT